MIKMLGRAAAIAIAGLALGGATVATADSGHAHRLAGPAGFKAKAKAVTSARISYRVYTAHDRRCLDSDISTRTHNGTRVQAWDCNGWDNQRWYYYTDNTIRSAQDGRCLDSDISTPTHDGTKVQVWDCNGWNNQKWFVYSDGTIRSKHDGRCLDEDVSSVTHNGTRVQVWNCNGTNQQKWYWRSLV